MSELSATATTTAKAVDTLASFRWPAGEAEQEGVKSRMSQLASEVSALSARTRAARQQVAAAEQAPATAVAPVADPVTRPEVVATPPEDPRPAWSKRQRDALDGIRSKLTALGENLAKNGAAALYAPRDVATLTSEYNDKLRPGLKSVGQELERAEKLDWADEGQRREAQRLMGQVQAEVQRLAKDAADEQKRAEGLASAWSTQVSAAREAAGRAGALLAGLYRPGEAGPAGQGTLEEAARALEGQPPEALAAARAVEALGRAKAVLAVGSMTREQLAQAAESPQGPPAAAIEAWRRLGEAGQAWPSGAAELGREAAAEARLSGAAAAAGGERGPAVAAELKGGAKERAAACLGRLAAKANAAASAGDGPAAEKADAELDQAQAALKKLAGAGPAGVAERDLPPPLQYDLLLRGLRRSLAGLAPDAPDAPAKAKAIVDAFAAAASGLGVADQPQVAPLLKRAQDLRSPGRTPVRVRPGAPTRTSIK